MTMAATHSNDLDEFLGVKPAPWWQRYVKWVLIGVGVILLILLAMRFFSGSTKPNYATETVERGSLSVSVSATGKLAPTNQVDVGSELSGLVTKVAVDVNDRVVAGQPLALIDPSRFSDTVNQSKAALDAAVAAVGQN
jgi:HlyD family secretion protein